MKQCVARFHSSSRQSPAAPHVRCFSAGYRSVAVTGLMAISCLAGAQDYPSRPIRLIAMFTPGGGADIYARLLAKKMSEIFLQQVVVDNRGGANGIIGTEMVANAAPNGYTVGFVTSALAVNPATRRRLPFDTEKDLAPISLFTEFPFFVVTHPSFAPQTIPELLTLVRAKPGQVNYGASTPGSALHFAGEMMKLYAKVHIVYVSYKGAAEATTATLAGEVPITYQGPTVMSHVRAGRLRVLGVTSGNRSPAWPDIPSVQEGGVPGYHYTTWHGVVAPRNTPASVVARLNQAVVQVVKDPVIAKALAADGAELHGNTPLQFHEFIGHEIKKFRDLVQAMGGLVVD